MSLKNNKLTLVDCTLRDGGYYNNWDFSINTVNKYLLAMKSVNIDIVELGFRFLNNDGFKGPCAYTTDNFLRSLDIPKDLMVGVMINASDLQTSIGWKEALEKLFPEKASTTPLKLVRIACHFHELENTINAIKWLKKKKYIVGLNLMQIAEKKKDEIVKFSKLATKAKPNVIYFADSLGSMSPKDVSKVINLLRVNWKGNLGVHTHDNMGLALSNTLEAYKNHANWLDSTVTGMGRGPGNAKTEELVIELEKSNFENINMVPLLSLIRSFFLPLKEKKKWGTNPYYYLSAKYQIHPSYIQVMMSDKRYNDEDILGVIDYLSKNNGKKFEFDSLNIASQFYHDAPKGKWIPETLIKNREVLILGPGPGVSDHKIALENFIKSKKLLVLALNIQKDINPLLINFFIASHPVKILADAEKHSKFSQPLILPVSMLPKKLIKKLGNKKLLDYGIEIKPGKFEFYKNYSITPNSLVLSYALAVCVSGKASKVFMAGFDGYENGDLRNNEIEETLNIFYDSGIPNIKKLIISVTPTRFKGLRSKSIYGFQ